MKRPYLPTLVASGSLALLALTAPWSQAATIVVTSTADNGPGTLRAALAGAASNDVITFAVSLPATITLTSGELFLPANVTINGPGAGNLSISGNNSGRVFHIGPSITVNISGLTIRDGLALGGSIGAGIYIENAALTLAKCTITNNQVNSGPGGGIHNDHGTLAVTNCTISNNRASNGGGIFNNFSTLTVSNSTFTGNSASNGGAIYNERGSAAAHDCTIYLNGAAKGGGIFNFASNIPATFALNNCTVTGNTASGATGSGGGLYNIAVKAALTISNSTISGNIAGVGFGGGIYNTQGLVTLGNTILKNADFEGGTLVNANAGIVTSAGYNLSSDAAAGLLNATGDQPNTDPLLDPAGLQNNGGPTLTIALQGTSAAVDKGKRDTIPALATSFDQRGELRPFDDPTIPNAIIGDASDIGAYEAGVRVVTANRLGNDLRLSFTTILGRNYQVQNRASLVSDDWGTLPGTVAGNGGIVPVTITNAFSEPRHFYRVRQVP